MSHRIDIEHGSDESLRIVVAGVLDAAAIGELTAALGARSRPGPRPVVILRAGCIVERSEVAALRALDAEIVAESPYLSRWLADTNGSPRRIR